jgi:hypothetical protein
VGSYYPRANPAASIATRDTSMISSNVIGEVGALKLRPTNAPYRRRASIIRSAQVQNTR